MDTILLSGGITLREKLWWFFHLELPCELWKLRGLERCKEHGFNGQSWITGECKHCKKDMMKFPKKIKIHFGKRCFDDKLFLISECRGKDCAICDGTLQFNHDVVKEVVEYERVSQRNV